MFQQSELDIHPRLLTEDLEEQCIYIQLHLNDEGEVILPIEVKEPNFILSLQSVLEWIDSYRAQRRYHRVIERMVRHLFTYEVDHLNLNQVPNNPAEALQWLWYVIERRHHDPDIFLQCKVAFEKPIEMDPSSWTGWRTIPAFFEGPFNDELQEKFRAFVRFAVYAKLAAEESAIKESLSRFPNSFYKKRDEIRLELLEHHSEEILREVFAIIDQKIMEINLYYRQFPDELPVIGSKKE